MARKAPPAEDRGHHSAEADGIDEGILEEIEHGTRIRVLEGVGINLELDAKVDHDCDAIYKVLTDPTAERVFRSIQACTNRKVLEDDNKGCRKLQVSHRAISKFLWISVTFETHLYVWENDRDRTIRFTNARDGFMKRFEGLWHVRPYTQHSLGLVCGPPPAATPSALKSSGPQGLKLPFDASWFNPAAMVSAAQRLVPPALMAQPNTSLVALEQHIQPNVSPPAPIRALVRRLVAKQLKDMMDDLKAELERRKADNAGTASSTGTGGGRVGKKALGLPAAAACITTSRPLALWECTEPLINITIQL